MTALSNLTNLLNPPLDDSDKQKKFLKINGGVWYFLIQIRKQAGIVMSIYDQANLRLIHF